jgi:lipopolysaccharide transport system ATP-binding protein
MTMITLENVGKYYIPQYTSHDSLRDRIGHWLKSLIAFPVFRRKDSPSREKLWALRNVNASIRSGECVGIIGHNGAGKSTLLKLISRVTAPSEGVIRLGGSVASLLELGVGFHPDLTGRENVYLAGSLLHMRKREIQRRINDIWEFSELGEAFDRPVRTYSSGMYMRLGFSVAAHLSSDIVVLDEVLAVGDLRFQQKCSRILDALRRRNATILLVSHNLFFIKALCSRVLYFRHGRLYYDGDPTTGMALYEKHSYLCTPEWALPVTNREHLEAFRVVDIQVEDATGKPTTYFTYGDPLIIDIHLRCRESPSLANVVISVIRQDGLPCCAYSSRLDNFYLPTEGDDIHVSLTIPQVRWVADSYRLDVLIWDHDFNKLYTAVKGPHILVSHPLLSREFGVFHESAQWQCISSKAGSSAFSG